MYHSTVDELIDFLKEKRLKHSIRVTTRLKGELKTKFLSDCIDRGSHESSQSNDIIGIYYVIIEQFPEVKKMEMSEVKKYLINKIKL